MRRLLQTAGIMLAALSLSWTLTSRANAQSETQSSIPLKILSFNIWYGGEQVNFDKVVEAIKSSDADIVGVLEPDGNLERLAKATGLSYFDKRRNIISRYPIFDSGNGIRMTDEASVYTTTALDPDNLHAWVMVRPGKVVAMANAHFSSDPYGPDAVSADMEHDKLIELENDTRLAEAQALAPLGELGKKGVPIFLSGDFNAPSHLDWTETVLKSRPEIKYAVEWPASKVLTDSGLKDSYREANPDPVAMPGFTWTPGTPHPFVPEMMKDRIDFIYHSGASEVSSSTLVGEDGNPDVSISVMPWPSDHRAVLSSFNVTPMTAPALIAVEPTQVRQGDDFTLRYALPGSEKISLLVVKAGQDADQAIGGVVGEEAIYRTGLRMNSHDLEPGAYDALLINADGEKQKQARFEVLAQDAKPSITLAGSEIASGDKLALSWKDGPANRYDWIGVFSAADPSVLNYLTYQYAEGKSTGDMEIELVGDDGPLPEGDYIVRLMVDDSYTPATSAKFSIKAK